MTDQALPCPCCSSDSAHAAEEGVWHLVRCTNRKCDLQSGIFPTKPMALRAWNTRPPSERPVAQVRDALEEIRKDIHSLILREKEPSQLLAIRSKIDAALTAERPEAAMQEAVVEKVFNLLERHAYGLGSDNWKTAEAIVAALTAERPEAGRENLTAEEFAQILPHEEPGRETMTSVPGDDGKMK